MLYKFKLNTVLKISPAFLIMVVLSCKEVQPKANAKKEETVEKKQYLPEKNEVDAMVLKLETFKKEIVSNGKLVALQKNQLKFDVSENLESYH